MKFINSNYIDKLGVQEKLLKYPRLLYDDLWYSLEKQNYIIKLSRRVLAFIREKVIRKIIKKSPSIK